MNSRTGMWHLASGEWQTTTTIQKTVKGSHERGIGRRVVAEDVFTIRSVLDAQVSSDGRSVAFVVADGYREGVKRPRANVWTSALDEKGAPLGEPKQFTRGGADVYPRWSPSGDKLAFLSDRADGEKLQVFAIDRSGGEATQLTEVNGDIGASVFTPLPQPLAWSPDGREIAFLMWEAPTPSEKEESKKRGEPVEYEKVPRYCGIWTVDVRTKQVRRRTHRSHQIWEFDWANDGESFAAVVSREPYEWSWYESKLAVISARTGSARTVHDPYPRQIARPLWSLDGEHLYFISSVLSDRNVVAGDLFSVRADGRGGARDLVKGYRGSVSWMEWMSPTQLLLSCIEGVRTVFSALDISELGARGRRSRRTEIWSGDVTLSSAYWRRFSISRRTGRIAVCREDLMNPTEAWVGRMRPGSKSPIAIDWTNLTEFNHHVHEWDCGEIKPVEWNSTHEGRTTMVQGFLMTPRGSRKAKKTPLVVIAHGGPTQSYGHRYYFTNAYGAHLWASRGFGVFLPNPRGSYGRGLRFAEANVGDMGGGDFADIMAGVDYCLSTGIFDPKRVYIMGGSYGGFMTAWAVTQTNRFRAAIMQWGISNWVSFHGTTSIPQWEALQYRSDPYDRQGPQHRFSPINYVKNVRTPTLIVQGADDTACPASQSQEFYRALKERGVETELVIYPGEGHGLSQKAHVLDALNRYVQWFTEH